MKTVTFFLLVFLSIVANAQVKVSFLTSDSLDVTADLYFTSKNNPYIVIFHGEDGSRGEAKSLAAKLVNMNYNCLAVDLRCGNESNYVRNETAQKARDGVYSDGLIDAGKDIISAINYAYYKNNQPVILIGSSFSASLALHYAINNKKVAGVVAFSPGEHFPNDFSLKKQLRNFDKPLFVSGIDSEMDNIKNLVSDVETNLITVFSPSSKNITRGINCLSDAHPENSEYWLSLTMFFNKLKK